MFWIGRKDFYIMLVGKGKNKGTTGNQSLFIRQGYVFPSFNCSNGRLNKDTKFSFLGTVVHL